MSEHRWSYGLDEVIRDEADGAPLFDAVGATPQDGVLAAAAPDLLVHLTECADHLESLARPDYNYPATSVHRMLWPADLNAIRTHVREVRAAVARARGEETR